MADEATTTVGEKSKITVGLVLAVVALSLGGLASVLGIWMQVHGALGPIGVNIENLTRTVGKMDDKLEKVAADFHTQNNGLADLRARVTSLEANRLRTLETVDALESRVRELEKK